MKNKLIQFVNWFENNFGEECWLDPETDEWRPYTELPEYLEVREALGMDEPKESSKINIKYIDELEVTDPDSGLPVHITIVKMETGGMVGVDSSFLDNTDLPVFSPYDRNIELDVD